MRREFVAASTAVLFRVPAVVFRSASMFCNRERIPFPRASFLFGLVMLYFSQDPVLLFYFGKVVLLKDLLGQVQVVEGALAFRVVQDDGFTKTRCLAEAGVPVHDRFEDEFLEMPPDLTHHLVTEP